MYEVSFLERSCRMSPQQVGAHFRVDTEWELYKSDDNKSNEPHEEKAHLLEN